MNDVTAVIGLEQLKYVDQTIAKHRAHAARYDQAFANLDAVQPLRYRDDRTSAHWLYTMRVKQHARFVEHMHRARITVSRVHARNDTHSVFAESRTPLPGVDEFTAEQVSIPVGWWLSDPDLNHIIKTVSDQAWLT